MLELYKNIKKYRLLSGMTQHDLALKTGYTDRSSIAKIENGDVDLPQSKIMLFAQALDVRPGDLMGDVDSSNSEVGPSLSPDQEQLLADYGKLNSAGKAKVREYASDLTEQKKYTEDAPSSGEKLA